MKQKRILSVQDVSCFGKCSNTTALPILSAAGLETVILPTALLSTHTGGFDGYTFLDLTGEMEKILAHWERSGIRFDGLYTGYFGSAAQLSLVADFAARLLAPDAFRLIDPVMGDGGRLYPIYDAAYVGAMRDFCRGADIVTPNVTEACLLAGLPYAGEAYDRARLEGILDAIGTLGVRAAVVTGVRFGVTEIGVVYRHFGSGETFTLSSARTDTALHGTGDVFAATLAGYLMNGFSPRAALSRTIAYMAAAIRDTEAALPGHWYGLLFERQLGMITDDVRGAAR